MARRDDDRELERAVILRRRAQLVTCAVVAGVGLPSCEPSYCLSPPAPALGGTPATGGASTAENAGEGGQAFCLTVADAAGAPAAGAPAAGAGGEGGGGPTLCLSVK